MKGRALVSSRNGHTLRLSSPDPHRALSIHPVAVFRRGKFRVPPGPRTDTAWMTEMATSVMDIVIRTLLVYTGVLVGLRVMGKRELAQMTVFDLVMILLIANAVQNAMTGPDFSVQGGLIAAASFSSSTASSRGSGSTAEYGGG